MEQWPMMEMDCTFFHPKLGHDIGRICAEVGVAAAQMSGGNFNALTDADEWDSLSGIAVLNGIQVEVAPQ